MKFKKRTYRNPREFFTDLLFPLQISQKEISQLLSGDTSGCPQEEAVAIAYALHWAESEAHPDPEAVQKLQATYGLPKAKAIHLVLRMIRLGNLTGNSFDYLLYKISFGKWQR